MNEHTSPPGPKPQRSKSPAARRMAAYRERMRAAGYRQVQIWVPDIRSPAFVEEYRRQARRIAENDPGGDEIMEWLDQVRDWPTD